MRDSNAWMQAYGQSHQNLTNRLIHIVCVPLILWSLLGLIWLIPVPWAMPSLNWAMIFCASALLFYANLSLKIAARMLLIALFCLMSFYGLDIMGHSSFLLFSSVFIISWIGQFIGHNIEGRKPSFFEDVQFLLIGPLWVLKELRLL